MYNYYRGNSGKARKVQDSADVSRKRELPRQEYAENRSPEPQSRKPEAQNRAAAPGGGILAQLGSFLPQSLGKLEKEDLILLLILYLMYKDSGDTELLIIMGALLFM